MRAAKFFGIATLVSVAALVVSVVVLAVFMNEVGCDGWGCVDKTGGALIAMAVSGAAAFVSLALAAFFALRRSG